MKKILTTIAVLLSTSIYSQNDTVSVDAYTTHSDSKDSINIGMTPEEIDEYWAEKNGNKNKHLEEIWAEDNNGNRQNRNRQINNTANTVGLILLTSGVQQIIHQNKQDYRNFYYRKRKHTR